MRKAVPKLGAMRIVKRFLFLPQMLYYKNSPDQAGTREVTRWLELAKVLQKRIGCSYTIGHTTDYYLKWKDIAWADLDEAEVTALEWTAEWEDDYKAG